MSQNKILPRISLVIAFLGVGQISSSDFYQLGQAVYCHHKIWPRFFQCASASPVAKRISDRRSWRV